MRMEPERALVLDVPDCFDDGQLPSAGTDGFCINDKDIADYQVRGETLNVAEPYCIF